MDDLNILTEKGHIPTDLDLIENLGTTCTLWYQIQEFVLDQYPKGLKEWNYPGKKYGYNYRIKDKKRAILYFLPRKNYFEVAFVYGQKATDLIMESDISLEIKNELIKARKYAEGRGIRIEVKNDLNIADIKKLVEIKLAN
ncbi:MAG: DUF3788 family protein [Aureibaculum sp.]|nr:DUF3788 family protein [Aureibaculum sp.]